MNEAGPSSARSRDAWRAAIVCGLWFGVLLSWQVTRDDLRPAAVAIAFVLWGLVGAGAGAGAVLSGGAWRGANGRWHVAPLFVALVVGTPVASLAGMMLGGEPYGPSAVYGGTAWAVAVGLAWMIARLHRRSA